MPPTKITTVPYIEIPDVEDEAKQEENTAAKRIKSAVLEASRLADFIDEKPKPKVNTTKVIKHNPQDQQKILSMQAEINKLKALLSQFQKVPQSFISMHPGASEGISYELSSSYEKLRKTGVTEDDVIKILKLAQRSLNKEQLKKPAYVDAWIAKHILDEVKVCLPKEIKKYNAFVGPSGHGKTSTLVKLASHLVICENKSIAIVTCDTYKVGASEQLKIYARILNVPFVVVRKPEDWVHVDKALSGVDHILVDYPGMGLRTDIERNYLLSMLSPNSEKGRQVHYVCSALTTFTDATEMLNRYLDIGLTDLIFTSVDESTQHGLIFSLQQKFKLPLHSFGIGPKVPEDFEAATKERVVDLIFKLTKLQGKRS